jgi:hypothetical protein
LSEDKEAENGCIPFANNGLYPNGAGVDEEALIMLNEILGTTSQQRLSHSICLKHLRTAG